MAEGLLVIRNLCAWYRKEKNVLSRFSLELSENEVVGLIGLNGAGKTTFLKILSGLLTSFDMEKMSFQGQSVNFRDNSFKTSRYTVFAEDNSFQYFTFQEYLDFVSAVYGKQLTGVTDLVKGFHFEDFTDVLFKDLSTGNRKKAYLITGFALRPKLLLLDEPVNGLDFQSTEYLYQCIAGYKKYGTVLFSSHILESITLTSDRVLVLLDGQIRHTFESGQVDAAKIREVLRNEKNV